MSNTTQVYLFYKPYDCLSQFTKEHPSHTTLADYLNIPSDVYPIGRLDKDSEGLLLLSADKKKVQEILHPKNKLPKTYYVQVEGIINSQAINQLEEGVEISVKGKKHLTLPAKVKRLENPPSLPPRTPLIRYRKSVPTSWISIQIIEGKNRQIRRMLAKVGFPVLRLVRYSIGKYTLEGLEPGNYRIINTK